MSPEQEKRDQTPCYLATCPACHGVVMICVADPSQPASMRAALSERGKCERAGLTVETLTVDEGRSRLQAHFGHDVGCARDPKQKRQRAKQLNLAGAR